MKILNDLNVQLQHLINEVLDYHKFMNKYLILHIYRYLL